MDFGIDKVCSVSDRVQLGWRLPLHFIVYRYQNQQTTDVYVAQYDIHASTAQFSKFSQCLYAHLSTSCANFTEEFNRLMGILKPGLEKPREFFLGF